MILDSSDSKPLYMLSSCGTSVLTNGASSELRGLLMRWANFVRGAVPEEVRAQLESHFASQRQRFLEAAEPEAKRLSAELNGLLTYFEQSPYPREQALHYLLISATWQGEVVGDILRCWLEGRGFHVQILALPDLVTDPLERFQNGLAELVRFCHSEIPRKEYQVLFNLTGGFKSVQGFLQTLALFYADGCISIFESGGLLRVPRLPVRLEIDPVIFERRSLFEQLERGGLLESEFDARDLPESWLYKVGNKIFLSAWGELMWLQARDGFPTVLTLDSEDV